MLSLFTPSNSNKFLPQVYASLKAQTDPEWEWTVLHNNGGAAFDCADPRVHQHDAGATPEWVGALKAEACARAPGDLLLELDHDDLLLPTAVAEVKQAFSDDDVGFVYSNTIHATGDLEKVDRFSEVFGWRYRETEYAGHALDEHIAFPPSPESVSRIWFAPNHLRAFRREAYDQVGGYNAGMRVLDDQDLMCRLYSATRFHHIDKPLYLYRIHGENTWLKFNAEIQNNVYRLHDQYAEPMAKAWAQRQGLRLLDLGGRIAGAPGYESVDRKNADVVCDLDGRWPFEDNSVGVIRAFDVFEHLRDPLHTMTEAYRVLAPGGWIFAQVPSTEGRGAFQDPTHRSFWNENCVTPDTKILCADFVWREAGQLRQGDRIIGFDEQPSQDPGRGKRLNLVRFRESVIEGNRTFPRRCIQVSTDIGPTTTASEGHPWLVAKRAPSRDEPVLEWRETKDLKIGDRIAFFGKPWDFQDTREGGWLAGMFDGEGCLHIGRSIKGRNTGLSIAQRASETLERLKRCLHKYQFDFTVHAAVGAGKKVCHSLQVLGGLYAKMRLLGMIAPARFMERDLTELYDGVWLRRGKTFNWATVSALTDAGERQVCGIQTSTKTLISDGYLTHNSWLYYTHANWAKYIDTPVRFQAPRCYTTPHDARGVCWTVAHLISLKDGYRPAGAIDI